MANKLSKQQALTKAKSYEYLSGKIILNERRIPEMIYTVCIAPLSKKDRVIFMNRFNLFKDAERAIAFYNGSSYEVIIIIKNRSSFEYSLLDAYLANAGVAK
jgi:hypothetical protein